MFLAEHQLSTNTLWCTLQQEKELLEAHAERRCLHEIVASQQLLATNDDMSSIGVELEVENHILRDSWVAQQEQAAQLQAELAAHKEVIASQNLLLSQSDTWGELVTSRAEVKALRRALLDQERSHVDSKAESDAENNTLKELVLTQQLLMAQPSSLALQVQPAFSVIVPLQDRSRCLFHWYSAC